jgi:flagellar basal-body rod protein FlgB
VRAAKELPVDKLDAEFDFGRQSLDLRAYRQQLLSENIANADTPGYKARDMDFTSTLSHALQASGDRGLTLSTSGAGGAGMAAMRGSLPMSIGGPLDIGSDRANMATGVAPLRMAETSAAHMAGVAGAAAAASAYGTPQYRVPHQPSLDGNTVELDSERVNFADNALHYETGLTVINQQIKTMLSAVSGGGS